LVIEDARPLLEAGNPVPTISRPTHALRARLDALQLRPVLLGSPATLVDCPARDREELLRIARCAETLGCPHLSIHAGGAPTLAPTIEFLREARDFLEWWEEERRWHGWEVNLVVETDGALTTSHACRRFLSAMPRSCDLFHRISPHRQFRPDDSWGRLLPALRFIRLPAESQRPSAIAFFEGTASTPAELPDVLRDALGIGGARGRADQRPAMHSDRISARV